MKTFTDYKTIDEISMADGKVVYRAVESGSRSFGLEIYSDIFTENEFSAVYDITDSADVIRRVLFDFADGFVEPYALRETVEDYLTRFSM